MDIMDRQDYVKKSNNLLNHPTYRAIPQDPTNTIKNKLISILKNGKHQTGLDNSAYKVMYPMGCACPKFYGLPKIHKPDTTLGPIVSSCGSVTYGVAKELAKILKPLVGHSQVEGAAMGSPVCLIVANLYMEYFETKTLSTAPSSRLWCRYMNDTFVIQKEVNKQNFLQHINSVGLAMQLQWRTTRKMVPSPFWTALFNQRPDGNLPSAVYRNLLTWTSTYSGTANTTSQVNLGLLVP